MIVFWRVLKLCCSYAHWLLKESGTRRLAEVIVKVL